MPRLDLTVTPTTITGAEEVAAQAGVGADDAMISDNDGRIELRIENTGGSPATITAVTTYARSNIPLEDVSITIPAGEIWRWGPFDPSLFNQPGDTKEVWLNFTSDDLMFQATRL